MNQSRYLLLLVMCFTGPILVAQKMRKYSELGPVAGVSYYMGDLNPGRQFFMPRFGGGLVYRYNYHPRWAWKIQASYMSIQADDAESKSLSQRNRNLSFRSSIYEFSPQIEFNFFPYEVGNVVYPATPYVFWGFALFRFNPKAEYKGEWRELQPLGTEGQGTAQYRGRNPYSLLGATFPFGFGVKFHFLKIIGVGVEWGLRKTFTDYLDDVSTTYVDPFSLYYAHGVDAVKLADRSLNAPGNSNINRQRGNSTTKDWYAFAGLTLTVKLRKAERVCQAYR
jgi:hypothetical protein